jgi:hypothetical protein
MERVPMTSRHTHRPNRPERSLLIATLFLAAVNPLACDCDGEPITQRDCGYEVETPDGTLNIEFPDTAVGAEVSRTIRVVNTGDVTLTNFTFQVAEQNGIHYSIAVPDDFSVQVNDSENVLVLFRPLAESNNLASRFTVSHPSVSGAACPSYAVQMDGVGFERIELDAGPDAGADAGDDAGPDGGPGADAGRDGGLYVPNDAGVTLPPGARFRARGAFQNARAGFAAVALDDGTVLAIGGYGADGLAVDTIERFDPRTGVSRVVATMAVPRAEPGAALIPDDGRVVIAGGRSAAADGFALTTVEVFDPDTGVLSCPPPQGACGLDDVANGDGILPEGRIGPVVSAPPPGGSVTAVVAFGRTLDMDGDEVLAAGGELLTLGGTITQGPLTGVDVLGPRAGEARVFKDDGSFLLIGGRSGLGLALSEIIVYTPAAGGLATVTPANVNLTARYGAAAALLSDGDVLVGGGFDGAGQPVTSLERILDPFDEDNLVDADVEPVDGHVLEPRLGASLVTLTGDIVLLAGGLDQHLDDVEAIDSVVPRSDAELFVPFGADNLLRVSPDNDLAVPRFMHEALAVTLPGDDAGVPEEEVVVFLGGSSTAPRRTAHPQAERFRIDLNAFEVYGLMGPGTAFGPNAPASLYSVGGIDPHTGSVSTRVRYFDTVEDTFHDAPPIDEPRRDHQLTLLDDNNTFLVSGGRDSAGQVLASAALYNPFNAYAEPLPVAMNRARAGHTTTLLPDGTVLLCGGQGTGGEALDTCEVFEPPPDLLDTETYDQARFALAEGRLSAGRFGHTATFLPETLEVLLVGGGDVETDLVAADLFSVADSRVRSSGQPVRARRDHVAVDLGAGRVLIAGGEIYSGGLAPTGEAEVYERANEIFIALEDEMARPRVGAAGIALTDGRVLIVGGAEVGTGAFPTRSIRPSELYEPGLTGIGEFTSAIDIPLTFGRSSIGGSEVFGRGLAAGGDRRDGLLASGDERRSPLYFVDKLVNPDEEPDGGPAPDGGP